jgi:ubiquinol-cytochrome c reductase cytochrome b subunit
MTTAGFGQLVRSIHQWTAYIVTITMSLHLLRIFLSGSYKAPREVNWLVGLGLLAITMGFFFTGTAIKWDQEGAEALAHNVAAAQLLGGIGGWFSPDFSLAVPLLGRVYFAHVAILPALFTLFIAAHILLIKALGMSPLGRADGRAPVAAATDKVELAEAYGEPMFPFTHHIGKIVGWGSLVISMILALAIAFPPTLGPSPIPGIEITKPPFVFWWLYAAEDALGVRGLLIIPVVFFGLLALVPFIDRGTLRSPGRRKGILIAGLVVVLVLAGLTIYTGLTPPVAHTQMK